MDARCSFYTPKVFVDPFGSETVVEYDQDLFLLMKITDAMGNTTTIANNYRVLKPHLMTDPNLNVYSVVFDELGVPIGFAEMVGSLDRPLNSLKSFQVNPDSTKVNEFLLHPNLELGLQLLQGVSSRSIYDLKHDGVVLAQIQREIDAIEDGVGNIQICFSYFSSFGQVVQTKRLCTPALTENDSKWQTSA
jgi:hypothetical protein